MPYITSAYMKLATQLLHRIALPGMLVWLFAFLVMMFVARRDIGSEAAASLNVGKMVAIAAAIQSGASLEDQVLSLNKLNDSRDLRHFYVALLDESGRKLTAEKYFDRKSPGTLIERMLVTNLHTAPHKVRLHRPDGSGIELVLIPNPYSESTEALLNALISFTFFALFGIALMGATWLSLRRALLPLQDIMAAIAKFKTGDFGVHLPRFGTTELNTIGQALNRLADSMREHRDTQRHLLGRIQDIQESERRRLAHDLHDEFGQSLTALQVEASFLIRQATQSELKECAKAIYSTSTLILEQVKDLLRQLRPYGLHGEEHRFIALEPALDDLIVSWRGRFGQSIGCSSRIELDGAEVPQRLAVAIYRIVQECLTNVTRHSQASHVDVHVLFDPMRRAISLVVSDDGIGLGQSGFDTAGRRSSGLGLAGIRERTLANHGELLIVPNQPTGLRIEAHFQLALPDPGFQLIEERRHAA